MEKLSPKEIVKGADTVVRGRVREPRDFPRANPKKIPREPSYFPAAQCRHPRHS